MGKKLLSCKTNQIHYDPLDVKAVSLILAEGLFGSNESHREAALLLNGLLVYSAKHLRASLVTQMA